MSRSLYREVTVIAVAFLCIMIISASLPASSDTAKSKYILNYGENSIIVKKPATASTKIIANTTKNDGAGTYPILTANESHVYSKSTTVKYDVNFTETGLPNATLWYIKPSGNPGRSSTSHSINCSLPNGTYSFYASSSDSSYAANGGGFTINGASTNISITFFRVYEVLFNAVGLKWNGTSLGWAWTVNISHGPQALTYSPFVQFNFPNGTYHYDTTSANKSYYPLNSSGSFTITGSSVSINITFKLIVFAVTFKEIGLPLGSQWTLAFNDTVTNISSTSVKFSVPNGTYQYSINACPNYTSPCESGIVNVNGSSLSKNVTFSHLTQNEGLSASAIIELVVIPFAVAVALVAAFYLKGRK